MDYMILKEKLNGEYLEAFNKVEIYATTIIMDGATQEEMLMNLLDQFCLINLLIYSGEEGFSLWKATTDISGVIFGISSLIIIYGCLNTFVKPWIFRWKKVRPGLFDGILVVVCIALPLSFVCISGD